MCVALNFDFFVFLSKRVLFFAMNSTLTIGKKDFF